MPGPDRRIATTIFLVALIGAPWLHAAEPENDPRVKDVASKLVCYCGCTSQSIADCACGVAQKERANIQARLDEGATAEEVVAEWVALRGTGILMEPPREGFNLLGWFLPAGVLLAAGLLLGLQVRRWARTRPQPAAAPQSAADPRYLEQLQKDLDRLEP